jgi:hypothetical protein
MLRFAVTVLKSLLFLKTFVFSVLKENSVAVSHPTAQIVY